MRLSFLIAINFQVLMHLLFKTVQKLQNLYCSMHGNNVLLTKKEDSGCCKIQYCFAVQCKISFRDFTKSNYSSICSENALGNVNKALAVERQSRNLRNCPKFSIFGIDFQKREEKHTISVATQDNLASYAYLEGMKEPYIIYRPALRFHYSTIFSI